MAWGLSEEHTRPLAGIGHNNGPTMEAGYTWRKHVWTRARADLLPTLPIEVVRLRVKRAAELGLPYKTYASVRASTARTTPRIASLCSVS